MAGSSGESPAPISRHARRRARTRAEIVAAANRLFTEKGYLGTSVEDISEAADIATRTIYMHFPSKAAILLDYFDRWLDALVSGILVRPVHEPIAEAILAASRAMIADGWEDRSYDDLVGSPPSSLGLVVGPPEIAGHMMAAWAHAQDRIIEDARLRGAYSASSPEPLARAVTVFAACMAPIAAARLSLDRGEPLPEGSTSSSLNFEFARLLTRGNL
ncbi:MAG: TetR family transcriptional regulator [Actinobacteria bacterium]|nr:TetR family transcriptional regulator [Actinomycetota bacterium]